MLRRREITDDSDDAIQTSTDVDPVIQEHWRAIQSWKRTSTALKVVNIRLIGRDVTEVKNDIQSIIQSQTRAFKVNYSYAYILRHKTTDRLRYFHASANLDSIFDIPQLIPNVVEFDNFVSNIDLSESFGYAERQRQNTEYMVICVTNITFYIYETSSDLVVGCPEDIKVNGLHVSTLLYDGCKNRIRDNRCLFRAIAVALGHRNDMAPVLDLIDKFTREYPSIDVSQGVHLSQLPKVEACFGLNVVVYTRDESGVGRILYIGRGVGTTIHLHLEKRHYCLITDIKLYCRNYFCEKCNRLCTRLRNFRLHKCVTSIHQSYPGGVFELSKTIHDKLELEGIYVSDKYYDYRAVFDFESFLAVDNLPTETEKMVFMNRHEPLSVGIASNVPGHQSAVVHVSSGDGLELIRRMVCTLEQIQATAFDLMQKRHEAVLNLIDEKIERAKVIDPTDYTHPLVELKSEFMQYLSQLVVIGFNSSKFDINLFLGYFLKLVPLNSVNVIKRGNAFMCLSTPKFRFLDISLYMSPGCSYAQYLKAYDTQEQKGFFPYEFMTSIGKLDYPRLPPHEAFYSRLKGHNISKDEYEWCVETWNRLDMKTLRDWLIFYNKLDVEPFIEALEKQFQFYRGLGIDMFKSAVSIPGLTERYVFHKISSEFTLLGEDDKDLHETYRRSLCGGPSLISKRYHERGVTFIKQYKYGRDARPMRKALTYDFNSLYPFCLADRVPTGFAVRYLPNADYSVFHRKKTEPVFGRTALEWLTWMSVSMNIDIHHQYKGKEVARGAKRIRVDGYYRNPATGSVQVFAYHGCRWHGHWCAEGYSAKRQERADRTLRVTAYLQSLGDEVISIYGCEWKVMRCRPEIKAVIDAIPKRNSPRSITKDRLIDMVKTDQFFGLLEVDIFTPPPLKEKFFEFCPIFKNVHVSLKDLSPHMREFGEKNGFMKKPTRLLIASYFGTKILLNTDLLKWYLDHGLEVTKIHQAVEYVPKRCFENFVQSGANYRRMGDTHPDKAIMASTYKLLLNCSYGKMISNRLKHKRVSYMDGLRARQSVGDPLFSGMVEIAEDLYEVTFQKQRVVWRDCIQIGLFVYMNAKLNLLRFMYDVLYRYINPRDIEYLLSDTDSIFIACSGDDLFSVIKPECREEFFRLYHHWFPSLSCDVHRPEFIADPENFNGDRPCCRARYMYDKRTPGLMKLESSSDKYVSLNSKTYACDGGFTKFACKGLSKRNPLTFDTYRSVLMDKVSRGGTNKSIIYKDGNLFTYEQQRDALSYFYAKRKVLPDGVNTTPLDL